MIIIPRTLLGRRVPLLTALAGLVCGLCVTGGVIALHPTSARAGGAAFPATSIVSGPANTLWFVQFQPDRSWFYSIGRISTQGTVTMFPISGQPIDIAPRSDGTLLIAMQGGVIWTITAQGDLRPFSAIPGGAATNIIAAPDGTVWFSASGDSAGPFIGHLTASGKLIAHERVPGLLGGLALDSRGNLWATETFGKAIDRISPRGTLSRFPLPTPGAYPLAIQPGPDGTMWFTEDGAIGHITASGRITPYVLPVTQDLSRGSGPQYDPYDLTAGGPDGGLWFTDQRADALGHITVHGQVSFHALPGSRTDDPLALTVGADGRLWFTTGTAQIGAMAPDGQVTMYKLPVSAPRRASPFFGSAARWCISARPAPLWTRSPSSTPGTAGQAGPHSWPRLMVARPGTASPVPRPECMRWTSSIPGMAGPSARPRGRRPSWCARRTGARTGSLPWSQRLRCKASTSYPPPSALAWRGADVHTKLCGLCPGCCGRDR